MSKTSEIFDFMKTCPQLERLWSIGGNETFDESVIIPNGGSSRYSVRDSIDVLGNYDAEIRPMPSVYEDFQVNCYKYLDTKDSTTPAANINVMAYDDVLSVCEWVEEQDSLLNFPDIDEVVNIEVNPITPQVRYVDDELGIIAYFITLRVRYVNRAKGREMYYANNNNT